ncbi:MAG: porin [Sutterellaceae bacterium]|nr:porin [Sutterellaceae bacterium]MDY2868422.1 porin [Mesosutterella sp.]
MASKKLIAAALLAAFGTAAYAAPSVTLYGIVDTGFAYQHTRDSSNFTVAGVKFGETVSQDQFSMESGINETSRWGLRGEEEIGGVTVGFNLENAFNSDDGEADDRLFQREALLSVSGKYGTLAAGRMGAVGSSAGTFDITQATADSFDGEDFTTPVQTMTDRYDNMLTYQTPKLAGFQATVQYSFKTNQKDGEGVEGKSSADRFAGAALTYEAGKFQSVFSYEWLDRSNKSYNSKDGMIYSLGANYDFDVVQVFGLVKYVDGVNSFAGFNADEVELSDETLADLDSLGFQFKGAKGYNLHLGAIVPMFGGSLTGGLYYADGKLKANGVADADLTAYGAEFRFVYPVSKRTDLYCGADFTQRKLDSVKVKGLGSVSGDWKQTETAVYAGLTHRF